MIYFQNQIFQNKYICQINFDSFSIFFFFILAEMSHYPTLTINYSVNTFMYLFIYLVSK